MNRLCHVPLLRRWAAIAGFLAGYAAAGCGSSANVGGQTGGEIPAGGPLCDAVFQELGVDEQTPLGVSAAEVLEPVLGAHASPLVWNSNTAPVTVGPEAGTSRIELTATYDGGRVAWVRFVPAIDAGSGPAPLLGCTPDRLEVTVRVELRTAGGALAERFAGTLAAAAKDNVELRQRLLLEALEGTLAVTTPEGISAPALNVNAVWDALGFRGTLDGEVIQEARDPGGTGGGSVGFGLVPYAAWPPPANPGAP